MRAWGTIVASRPCPMGNLSAGRGKRVCPIGNISAGIAFQCARLGRYDVTS
jgi:hypothetical protein